MNKTKKLLIIILGIFLIGFVFEGIIANKSNVYKEQKVGSIKKNKKLLSINLEQTAGAGDYKTVTQSNWPTDGYVFNEELSKCENGSTLSWDEINKKVIVSGSLTDKCYVYFDIYVPTLAEYIINNIWTGTQGDNSLYYHNSSLINGASDNSYRYAGKSNLVNNYVCFNYDETNICPTGNLYRIVGVFDNQVKLMKISSIGKYPWDESGINTWSTSSLNKYLNETFYNQINPTWQNMIETTTWKVGGNTGANIRDAVPSVAYKNEIETPAENITHDAKIGLLYASDFGFAVSPSLWTTTLFNYSISSSNWMNVPSFGEWTITPLLSRETNSLAFRIASGYVTNNYVNYIDCNVRPSFYLKSDVRYAGGVGSSTDPFRISMN